MQARLEWRRLSLRWLGVSSLLTCLAVLLAVSGILGYFVLRNILWVNGLIGMDWLVMSRLGVTQGQIASEVDSQDFFRLIRHRVEVPEGWQDRAEDFSAGVYAVKLLDVRGRVLSCAPPAAAPSSADLAELDKFSRRLGNDGPQRHSFRDAQDRQVLLIPLSQHGKLVGFAMMSNNWWPSRATLSRFSQMAGLASLLIFVIILIVYLLLVRQLSHPLGRLVACARQVTAGDLTVRCRLEPGANEISLVGTAFDAMLDRLERLFQAQQNFVGDVSHELRTPLTALTGQLHILETLQARQPDPGAGRALEKCEKELERMVSLVENLLALMRAEQGPPASTTFSLQELMMSALESVSNLYPERHFRCQHGGDICLKGDLHAWRRALQNLIENACLYSEGEIQVEIHREGQGVRLDVRDQGPGIPPESLSQLGQRFFRPDSSRSRNTGGSGLGLAIARATAQQHGGWLRITSLVGQGTTASLYLPGGGGGA